MKLAALTAVTAASVIGIGAYVLINVDRDSTAPIPPATSDSPTEPAPDPSTTSSPVESQPVDRTCSASELGGTAIEYRATNELPAEVREMRTAIIDLAVACDYERLEEFALAGSEGFQYSYGVEDSPSSFWRAREREARRSGQRTSEYMRYLVQVLQLPYCTEVTGGKTFYVWPRVTCATARTDADWNAIEGLYTQEMIDYMRETDLYYGFRVGILEDGDWVYFVAGD